MKKIISAIISAALFTLPAYADGINVYINDKNVEFNQPPIIYNDLTFVPFRTIFEEFGMVVQWHDEDRRATAFNHDYNISFITGSNYIYIDGFGTPIPNGPIIENSRMLIPLRALVEGIDGDIYWDENTHSVYIYSDQVVDDSNWEDEILRLTNEIRSQYGLCELIGDASLARVGREHCMDMAAREYFDHINPEGKDPFERMHDAGIWAGYAGENIAAGQIDPADVVNAWMNSDEHRENILTPEFTRMGAALYRGGNYGTYWAQEFAG